MKAMKRLAVTLCLVAISLVLPASTLCSTAWAADSASEQGPTQVTVIGPHPSPQETAVSCPPLADTGDDTFFPPVSTVCFASAGIAAIAAVGLGRRSLS